jgi:hypothetical protein
MARVLDLPPIDQGAAFKHSFFWFDVPDPESRPDEMVPISLTGYEGLLQIRTEQGNFSAETLLASWSTDNTCLVFVDNEVQIFVPASATSLLTFEEGYYDLLIWPTANPEDKTRMVQGKARTSPGVSKVVI